MGTSALTIGRCSRYRSRRRVPSRRRPLASGLHEHRIRPLLAIAITSHNSLWDFIEDFLLDTPLTSAQRSKLANPRSRLVPEVPFREKDLLETHAADVLNKIDYATGQVHLHAICSLEKERCNLKIQLGVSPTDSDALNPVL